MKKSKNALSIVGKNTMSLFLTIGLMTFSLRTYAQGHAPLRRSNSFFGIHFDFHATQADNQIGKKLTPDLVDSFLVAVHPDFIQVDTKGHPGYASYPTKVGISAPAIAGDPLSIFRKATAKRGVGLYSHYSGILDGAVATVHADWARVDASGKKDQTAVSIFSNYADSYLIPELKELSDHHVDGVWIDGDCWALQPDYSPAATNAYTVATGNTHIPRVATDPDYHSYVQFTRDAYHKYLIHYVNALHKYNPKLQICSNWAYAYMLGPVDAKVDFLSGDINSDDPTQLEYLVRLLSSHNLPWDLMGWGRTAARPLEIKAAIALAQGGAYEVYLKQNRDASLPLNNLGPVIETARFCRSRKAYCFKTKPIPQVAILMSSGGFEKESNEVFGIGGMGIGSVQNMLSWYLSMHYSAQVLQEYQLTAHLSQYPLIIIPGWKNLEPSFVSKLKQYVRNGGKLLITGGDANNLFNDAETETLNISYPNSLGITAKTFKYGNGTIVGIFTNLFASEIATKQDALKQVLAGITNTLFPIPIITTDGPGQIHVNATTKNGQKFFHLVNADFKNDVATGPLNIKLHLAAKPSAIFLQPGNKRLEFTYNNETAKLTIPGVDIYSILQVKK